VLLVQARSKAWAARRVGTPAVQTAPTPTLRIVREGWGTLLVVGAGEIKSVDYPPRRNPPRCKRSLTPTLRKVREGWGTLVVAGAGEIKSVGYPPRRNPCGANGRHSHPSQSARRMGHPRGCGANKIKRPGAAVGYSQRREIRGLIRAARCAGM
jgi:hypothetical protein